MSEKRVLSWADVEARAFDIVGRVQTALGDGGEVRVYPIPRGGIYAALAVQTAAIRRSVSLGSRCFHIVPRPGLADVYVDDIIDSGATLARFSDKPFFALVDKRVDGDQWFEFPWETMCDESGPQENIRRIIEFIGDDPSREGLRETPDRVVRSYSELFSGYSENPEDVIKTFEDGACDEMVVVRDIEFFSTCEHHMLPFFGKAHIAYIPNHKVVGVSKLVRLLEVFSRRLQIQERLCCQITGALDEHLKPKGSACVMEAQHFCMTARGVQKQHSVMVTSSLTGVFREVGNQARNELLTIIR